MTKLLVRVMQLWYLFLLTVKAYLAFQAAGKMWFPFLIILCMSLPKMTCRACRGSCKAMSQPCPESTCRSVGRMKSWTRWVMSSKATFQRAIEPVISRSTKKHSQWCCWTPPNFGVKIERGSQKDDSDFSPFDPSLHFWRSEFMGTSPWLWIHLNGSKR